MSRIDSSTVAKDESGSLITTRTETNGTSNYNSSSSNKNTDSSTYANVSNTTLEYKLKQLRKEAIEQSQLLTQKLASSQSGQNLLHIGTSLNTLPPTLHQIVTQLYPLSNQIDSFEKQHATKVQNFVDKQNDIITTYQRVTIAQQLSILYQDLVTAERIVIQQQNIKKDSNKSSSNTGTGSAAADDTDGTSQGRENSSLDSASALERASYIAVFLLQELNIANEYINSTMSKSLALSKQQQKQTETSKDPKQTLEYAQFVVKLAVRIRRLESDIISCLGNRIEVTLQQLQQYKVQQQQQSIPSEHETTNNSSEETQKDETTAIDDNGKTTSPSSFPKHQLEATITDKEIVYILILGHCLRSMVLLNRSNDIVRIFVRVAIVPILRSNLSMGSIDDGGSRGECKGLGKLLNALLATVASIYKPFLAHVEYMFRVKATTNSTENAVEVDLVTEGIWVPIVSALMNDSALKMTIFSPGIASILQSNYSTLDIFLAKFASNLLSSSTKDATAITTTSKQYNNYYYQPGITSEQIQSVQNRIYAHPKTVEFNKKWNLPIYYQLRFGECCTRLNRAIDETRKQGWIAPDIYTGTEIFNKDSIGYEIGLFLELHDLLLTLWKPNVIIKPLTNRFLRGAIQLVGRVVAFINDGMVGEILFGADQPPATDTTTTANDLKVTENGTVDLNATTTTTSSTTAPLLRKPYCWGDTEQDVAAVAWELTILDSMIRDDYPTIICGAIHNEEDKQNEETFRSLIGEVLSDAASQVQSTIDSAWNEQIVKLLINKCSGPLAAVKGIAATYRMTNRPPPSHASPFVNTILRPLKDFNTEFLNRTPDRVGNKWKQTIVVTVSDKYSVAVEELIVTVQRTEEALKNRKTRRVPVSGSSSAAMSDGEKVKLQLYLDYQSYLQSVRELNIDPATIIGISKLRDLTIEGQKLYEQQQQQPNGS